jgi:hypothetical protein
MEDLEHTLDLEEFIDASMRLYDTLKLPDKNMILSMRDKWSRVKENYDEHYSFHPNINKNSLKIASKSRHQGENVADVLHQRKYEYDLKMKGMRRDKYNSELAECTFQPQMVSNNRYQGSFNQMNIWEENDEAPVNLPRNDSFFSGTHQTTENNEIYSGYDR